MAAICALGFFSLFSKITAKSPILHALQGQQSRILCSQNMTVNLFCSLKAICCPHANVQQGSAEWSHVEKQPQALWDQPHPPLSSDIKRWAQPSRGLRGQAGTGGSQHGQSQQEPSPACGDGAGGWP